MLFFLCCVCVFCILFHPASFHLYLRTWNPHPTIHTPPTHLHCYSLWKHIIIIFAANNMQEVATTAWDKPHRFIEQQSVSFEYCEDNITPQWLMFATAWRNSWVNVIRQQYNQSPYVTLWGPNLLKKDSLLLSACSLRWMQNLNLIRLNYQTLVHCQHYHWLVCSTGSTNSGVSTRNPHSSWEGRAEGVRLLFTHTNILAQGAMQTPYAVQISAAFFFFCVFSRCRVLFVTPFLCSALLGSPPGDLSQPLTASGALLDWIYMICPSINGEKEGERNGSLSVKSEIETRGEGEKLGWIFTRKHKTHTTKEITLKNKSKQNYIEKLSYITHACRLLVLMFRIIEEETVFFMQWCRELCSLLLLLAIMGLFIL